MIPGKIFTSFAEIHGNVSVKDFRLPFLAPRTFARSFVFPEKFLFCTHMLGSIGWPSPAPRWHIDDYFEIYNFRWEFRALLQSNHQNFLHEVRLRHCVFCTGLCNFGPLTDLAISVFREMSINTVFTQICTLNVGSQDSSWEKLACESLCSRTLSSTRFSLNSCSHSGMSTQRVTPIYLWFFFVGIWDFIGLVHNGLPRSIVNLSWHSHWRDVTLNSILSFSSLVTIRCYRWWRRRAWRKCGTMTLLS